jgi:hypothetical protein
VAVAVGNEATSEKCLLIIECNKGQKDSDMSVDLLATTVAYNSSIPRKEYPHHLLEATQVVVFPDSHDSPW